MIEKMKAVCIVAQDSHKEELLTTLRDLGILHIAEKQAADADVLKRFSMLSHLSLELKDYAKEENGETTTLSDEQFEQMYQNTVRALEQMTMIKEKRTDLVLEAERIKMWGDFDAPMVKCLCDQLDLHFYRMEKREYKRIKQDTHIKWIRLSPVEKMETVAVFGRLDTSVRAMEFVIPSKGLSQLQEEIKNCELQLSSCEAVLREAAGHLNSYAAQLLKTQNDAEYSSADRSLAYQSGLVWITGYIPDAEKEAFINAAKEHNWAWLMNDVQQGDENVPTKIRYNKLTALIKPVFDILGTVPGYAEYDISFWFLAFFTLFFAMIIGDAGYGLLFLIGTVAVHIKNKHVTNVTLLFYLLSGATVVWGALTGTWFGLEGAMNIPLLKSLVIPSFANYPEYFGLSATTTQNSVMKFCFSIGVIQLALACVMNIKRKICRHNLSWLSDLGWLLSISALYLMVLYLVIGQNIQLGIVGAVVGLGFLLVVLFGGMEPGKTFGQGLKAGLGNTFTAFLDTISAFGNVMSYIRLFAVGMASLAIAQSFNNMASGFHGALVIVGAIIMIIGHVLNIVMGFLSVVVHGVRLNLLEFSGQLGMEWSGTAYNPFRDRTKNK
ncbi:MAG: hypothetical protein KHW87_00090 [Clostridiales bacterium]|nr:hypothetical protein [Clostridiales bacterium]